MDCKVTKLDTYGIAVTKCRKLRQKLVEVLWEIDEISCKGQFIYKEQYNLLFKEELQEKKRLERLVDELQFQIKYIQECNGKNVKIDDNYIKSGLEKIKAEYDEDEEKERLDHEIGHGAYNVYFNHYNVYCELNHKHKENIRVLHPELHLEYTDHIDKIWDAAFQAYCENDLITMGGIRHLEDDIVELIDGVPIDSIHLYNKCYEEKFVALTHYLYTLKLEFPYNCRHAMQSEEWVSQQKADLVDKINTLKKNHENLESMLNVLYKSIR